MIKFSHTIFAMPFAVAGMMWGFQVAGFSQVDILIVCKIILCMVFARSAAMAFNRYIDREIDAKNPRTQVREIPAGIISPNNALFFILVNCTLFVLTTAFINPLCLSLSPVALGVILAYSYTKRFTALCHLVLGLGLSLAPIGAFFAVTAQTAQSFPAWVLSAAVLCWTAGFDIIYALQDEDFDRINGLNSIPVRLGKKNALYVSKILHLLTASFILGFVVLSGGNILMWGGAAIFISLLIYQHFLVSPQDLSKVNIAFFTTNGVASLIFGICVLLDILLR